MGGDTDNMTYDQLSILEITEPGVVHLVKNGAADYPRITGSQLFGVDSIVVANGKAYLGYPTLSGASNDLRVVNLGDFSVKKLTMFGFPTGVATIPIMKLYFPIFFDDAP